MENTFKQQIDNWTQAEEHDKIIEMLEKIPPAERDFEITGLLARAYNYNGEYEKGLDLLETIREEGTEDAHWNFRMGYALYALQRYKEALYYFQEADELNPEDEDTLNCIRACHVRLPFRKRVEDFWEWFTANEAELWHMVENRNEYDMDQVSEFVSEGTKLLHEDVHFNIGEDYEFTFSVNGNSGLFYLYPYLVSRLPDQFKDKWHFSPFNQGADTLSTFDIYGIQVDMTNVHVAVTYQEKLNNFVISFYEEELYSLPEEERYDAYFLMTEIILGEGLSYQYIADIQRADALSDDMIPLPELRKHITEALKAHGKEVYEDPRKVYVDYHLKPKFSASLRYDGVVGNTCFESLAVQYYRDSTELFDLINQFGAQAVFLTFPFENGQKNGKKYLTCVTNWKTAWKRKC